MLAHLPLYILAICTLLELVSAKPITPGYHRAPLHKLAFGSCNKHDLPQPLWPRIFKPLK